MKTCVNLEYGAVSHMTTVQQLANVLLSRKLVTMILQKRYLVLILEHDVP
jgi:hypothetical protein